MKARAATRTAARPEKIALGDWQTPLALAERVVERVARETFRAPRAVLEPTCGEGAFLVAAAARFPGARLFGYELDARRAATARTRLDPERGDVAVRDFFGVDWVRELAAIDGDPVLVVGNPPWVTNARQGVLGARNLPPKCNESGLAGYEALTGKSNFDVSEWMIVRMLDALRGRDAAVAVLCKSSVARRVIAHVGERRWPVEPGGLFRIDAGRHFDAAVDAVLFVCRLRANAQTAPAAARWPTFEALDAETPLAAVSFVDGALVADAAAHDRTRHLAGACRPEWRSGVKHDCAPVMELARGRGGLRNGLGERVDVEDTFVFPLLKSSDVANRRLPTRAMIVPQRALGEGTEALATRAPKLWAYLRRHARLLDARKSSIYRRQPRFALFGVGPYTFAPWKVAVSALYKRFAFEVVGPADGRPVLFDDTCYFLPFAHEAEARAACAALRSEPAKAFLGARTFWDAKRPINKATLQALDLAALLPSP
jgi:hypothetical protein